ncbi:MAG: hypothetical protein R6V55_15395 [Desulfovermiculus sp.]
MLSDISRLMDCAGRQASYETYRDAVVLENVLSKPSQKSRKLAWRHLSRLYSLSSDHCLFRAFRKLYFSADKGQSLLAFQFAYARDPLLRTCAPFVLGLGIGQQITSQDTKQMVAKLYPDRFTSASRKSFAQNMNGTWTQAGFLRGKVTKTRVQPVVSWVNVAFALFMAFLQGSQAKMMLVSEWVRLLGLSEEEVLHLASQAAQKGFMVYRRTGDVMEFRFPGWFTNQEHEWLHESN